jgi:hypothetical protein
MIDNYSNLTWTPTPAQINNNIEPRQSSSAAGPTGSGLDEDAFAHVRKAIPESEREARDKEFSINVNNWQKGKVFRPADPVESKNFHRLKKYKD